MKIALIRISLTKYVLLSTRESYRRNNSVIQLMELMQIHKSKVGEDDHWRAFTYSKCNILLNSL